MFQTYWLRPYGSGVDLELLMSQNPPAQKKDKTLCDDLYFRRSDSFWCSGDMNHQFNELWIDSVSFFFLFASERRPPWEMGQMSWPHVLHRSVFLLPLTWSPISEWIQQSFLMNHSTIYPFEPVILAVGVRGQCFLFTSVAVTSLLGNLAGWME